jgi:hypothetical protein
MLFLRVAARADARRKSKVHPPAMQENFGNQWYFSV